MEAAIADKGFRPWFGNTLILTVNFPLEMREEHEIRATLMIGQTSIDFDWATGDSEGHFHLTARLEEKIVLEGLHRIDLEMDQDRGLITWTGRSTALLGLEHLISLPESPGAGRSEIF